MPAGPKATLGFGGFKLIGTSEDVDLTEAEKALELTGLLPDEVSPGSPADVGYALLAPYDSVRQRCALTDLNTISGSSERLRQSLGGYFHTTTDSRGLLNVPPQFVTMDPDNNIHPSILMINSVLDETVVSADMLTRGFDPTRQGAWADFQKTILPTTEFMCRVEGDPTSKYLNDVLRGSKYWKTLWTGGTYLNSYIEPIYNEGAYDDHFTIITTPYNNKERNYLKDATKETEYIGATYDYNRHFRKYQNWAANIDDERKMPIWDMLNFVEDTIFERFMPK